MISHENKCIFIHIPKCAGTSIENALGHFTGHSGRGGQDHRSIRMIEQPFLTPDLLKSKENIAEVLRRIRYRYSAVKNPRNRFTVTKEQYNSYYKFTFVRNPWARAFSWYKNVMRDEIHKKTYNITCDLSFKDYLRMNSGKDMLRPQLYWIKSFDGSIKMDFIGRFETLTEDFQHVCRAINLPQIELPHKIQGKGEDYRKYYDSESIDIISKIYDEEIKVFDYSFSD